MVRALRPDLILLDLMLPGKDGLRVCRELRRWTEVPIIMVTARWRTLTACWSLELGADDYIHQAVQSRGGRARPRSAAPHARCRCIRWQRAAGGLAFRQQPLRGAPEGQLLTLTPVEFRFAAYLRATRRTCARVIGCSLRPTMTIGWSATARSTAICATCAASSSDANGGVDLIRSVYGVGFRLE